MSSFFFLIHNSCDHRLPGNIDTLYFSNFRLAYNCSNYFLIKEWYRQELKKILPELITKWEKVIGVKCNDWGVK
jgi:hypothetical protein